MAVKDEERVYKNIKTYPRTDRINLLSCLEGQKLTPEVMSGLIYRLTLFFVNKTLVCNAI